MGTIEIAIVMDSLSWGVMEKGVLMGMSWESSFDNSTDREDEASLLSLAVNKLESSGEVWCSTELIDSGA